MNNLPLAAMNESKQAYIGTQEVTIQVLRVDGKKMTLQLFRQIPQNQWLKEDSQPNEALMPWGRVHYKIPKEGTEWLLAERGGKLYRCNIDRPSTSDWTVKFYEQAVTDDQDKLAKWKDNPFLFAAAEASIASHREGVSKATADLAKAKLKDEALSRLEEFPQLFLA